MKCPSRICSGRWVAFVLFIIASLIPNWSCVQVDEIVQIGAGRQPLAGLDSPQALGIVGQPT
jgi:hypothetical protein